MNITYDDVERAFGMVLKKAGDLGAGILDGFVNAMKAAADDWPSVVLLLLATIGGITILSMICAFLGIVECAESFFVISLVAVGVVTALAAA